MANTPTYRYEVSCDYCGQLEHFPKKNEAFEFAQRIAEKHSSSVERIVVYDIMAHKGNNRLWDKDGEVLL